jgi:hypothetical protein
MSEIKPLLVTSEMMNEGVSPLLFTGGACNIQAPDGPVRNPGRDRLAVWLDEQAYSYFDPQIHPTTHGRAYQWELDGPNEKLARETAKLRIYEVTATTIGAVSMMEIMDDARHGRKSIVWFHGGRSFAPIGLGNRDELRDNSELRQQVGELAFSHLLAYVNAGRLIRNELTIMMADCPHIIMVDNYEEVKEAITHLLRAP